MWKRWGRKWKHLSLLWSQKEVRERNKEGKKGGGEIWCQKRGWCVSFVFELSSDWNKALWCPPTTYLSTDMILCIRPDHSSTHTHSYPKLYKHFTHSPSPFSSLFLSLIDQISACCCCSSTQNSQCTCTLFKLMHFQLKLVYLFSFMVSILFCIMNGRYMIPIDEQKSS